MTWYPTNRGQILGALGAVCLAFVIGRGTQKTITVEKIREVEKVAERRVEAARAETAVAKQANDSDKIQWRTRTIYTPGGTVEVVKEVVREVDKGVTVTKVETVEKVVNVEKTVFRDRLQTVVLPKWGIGAHVGMGLDWHARYGGHVDRRLVEGLWLTAGVDVPTRAATLGLRVEF